MQAGRQPRQCVRPEAAQGDVPLSQRARQSFYIKYRGRLCGDVCLHPDGEINIVAAKSFQNKHIGRRVIGEIQKLAREQHIPKLHAEIYSFNAQSQWMFERAGFHKAGDELYEMEYNFQIEKAPAR